MDHEPDPSALSKVRGRVGAEYFKKFEDEIIKLLVEKKVIKVREQMVEATVYPAGECRFWGRCFLRCIMSFDQIERLIIIVLI